MGKCKNCPLNYHKKVKFALILVRFYVKIALKLVRFGIFYISLYPHLSKKQRYGTVTSLF